MIHEIGRIGENDSLTIAELLELAGGGAYDVYRVSISESGDEISDNGFNAQIIGTATENVIFEIFEPCQGYVIGQSAYLQSKVRDSVDGQFEIQWGDYDAYPNLETAPQLADADFERFSSMAKNNFPAFEFEHTGTVIRYGIRPVIDFDSSITSTSDNRVELSFTVILSRNLYNVDREFFAPDKKLSIDKLN